jgi:hypothetical protein
LNVVYSRGFNPSIQFPLTDGDIVRIPYQGHDNSPVFGPPYTPPTGLDQVNPYYIIDVTGSEPNFKHQLSLTPPPGTAVRFSDNGNPNTGGSVFELAYLPSVCPAKLANLDPNSPLPEALGTVATAVACGFSGTTAAYNAIKALTDANLKTVTFPNGPVWAMAGTF